MRNDNFDFSMQNLKLKILETHWCFLPADSLQNIIKLNYIKECCLYVTLYFVPLTLKNIGNLVYIKIYKDAKRFHSLKLKIAKDPKIGLHP